MVVLKENDLQAVLDFEMDLLGDSISDPMEREMSTWHAPWRKEALEHYLSMGWSFGIYNDRDPSNLNGYVLAQPLLFFRGLTQTLWVEHMNGKDEETFSKLVEIVYRWSRDKHLQTLILPSQYKPFAKDLNPVLMDEEYLTIKTSKYK